MNQQINELHGAIVDLYILMSQPKRDAALLEAAGVQLDRALFPLLVGIEKKGPVGIGDLADMVGRDYSTVSRQVAKLEELGLAKKKSSSADQRVTAVQITSAGKAITDRISTARQAIASKALGEWRAKDLKDLTKLLRRLIGDLGARTNEAAK